MPLLNFQKQFAPLVESGQKTQTIRARRKHPIKVGDTVHLYTGLRRPGARWLGIGRVTSVRDIAMYFLMVAIEGKKHHNYANVIEELAKADGFASVDEMLSWFLTTHGLPFYGQVIRWRLLKPTAGPETQET